MQFIFKPLFIAICAVFILLISCGPSRDYGKIYPNDLHKEVDFNMSLSDFGALKGTSANDMQDDDFRWIYTEVNGIDGLTDIVYYFDKDGDQPLYEMIFIYKDTTALNKAADKLLGAPNDGEEWRIEGGPHVLTAWKYKTKLVMAALIPKTEWNDN